MNSNVSKIKTTVTFIFKLILIKALGLKKKCWQKKKKN